MNLLEVGAAAIIALSAMTGGALLNAAITAPENCQRVIFMMQRWVWPALSSAIALISFALANRYWWGGTENISSDATLWIAVAQIIFLAMFRIAWAFTEAADQS